MAENNELEGIAQFADPSRRKFLFGLISSAIAAPTVISFVSGAVGSSANASNVVPMGGLVPNQYGTYWYDPSANWPQDVNAGHLCDISANYTAISGVIFSDVSGNAAYAGRYMDSSGNILYHDVTSNFYYQPSGNWFCDPSMNFLYDPSGNWTPLTQNVNSQPTTPAPTNAPTTTTAPVRAETVTPTTTTVPKALPETR